MGVSVVFDTTYRSQSRRRKGASWYLFHHSFQASCLRLSRGAKWLYLLQQLSKRGFLRFASSIRFLSFDYLLCRMACTQISIQKWDSRDSTNQRVNHNYSSCTYQAIDSQVFHKLNQVYVSFLYIVRNLLGSHTHLIQWLCFLGVDLWRLCRICVSNR